MTCCEVESQNPKTQSSVPRCNHFPSLSHVNIIPQKPLQNKIRLLFVTISSQTDSDWCLQSKQSKKKRRANYFRIFFWSGLGIIFGFLLLCFSCFSYFSAFPAFPASLLFCFFSFLLLLLLAFSAFLLFCFPCSPASLLFCFFAFLFFLFLCFSAFPAFPASLLFCFSCFFAFLLFCFCAFPVSLLLCFFASLLFFALPALNTWFSCKMHFAQYLHPWVSHDQPSLEN